MSTFPSFTAIRHKYFENPSTQPPSLIMECMNTSLHKVRNKLHLVWSLVHQTIMGKFKKNILFDLLANFEF